MSVSIFIDVLLVAYVLSRQLRVRPVPRIPRLQLPVILGVVGLIQLLSYTGSHHVSASDYEWLAGTLVVGAILLGAVRALTVKIWVFNNWVVRQGNWLTIALWVVSFGLHFVIDSGSAHTGSADLGVASLLLYAAVTYGVQNYVVHRRAMPLWDALGPEAGQRIRVNFGQGPGGVSAFFTTFGGGPGSPGSQPPPPSRYNDPTIIDAEVVEDDEGPAELR